MQNNINEIKLCIKVNEIETKFTLRYASASHSNLVCSEKQNRKNTLTNSYIFYCWSNLICETEGKKKRQVGNKRGKNYAHKCIPSDVERDVGGGNPTEGIFIPIHTSVESEMGWTIEIEPNLRDVKWCGAVWRQPVPWNWNTSCHEVICWQFNIFSK